MPPPLNKDIQDFFALAGKTVTMPQMVKFTDAIGKSIGNPQPEDLIDWLYRQAKDFSNRHTRNKASAVAEAAVPTPDLWTD